MLSTFPDVKLESTEGFIAGSAVSEEVFASGFSWGSGSSYYFILVELSSTKNLRKI